MTEQNGDNKPVLAMYGGHSHRPLWKPLSDHYHLAFLSSGAANEALGAGIECTALEQLVDQEKIGYMTNEALWMTSRVMDRLMDGSFSLDGAHPQPHLKLPDLAKWFPNFINDQLVSTLVRALSLSELQMEKGLVGVVTHEDVTPEGRIMAQVGQIEELPVIHIPHANHFIAPNRGDIHGQVFSDRILAAGTWMRDWYIAAGADPDSIEIVGAPQWDWMYEEEKLPSREHARLALAFEEDDLIIAYATTWHQETNIWGRGQQDLDMALGVMLDTIKDMGAKLIVKMHPGEGQGRENFYRRAMWAREIEGCVTRKHNDHVLRASDCLVSQGSSNIGVAAMILGTPVVELWQCGTQYPEGFGVQGTWGDGLQEMIREAIDKGPDPEFVRAMNYDNDGRATERIVERIREAIPA